MSSNQVDKNLLDYMIILQFLQIDNSAAASTSKFKMFPPVQPNCQLGRNMCVYFFFEWVQKVTVSLIFDMYG